MRQTPGVYAQVRLVPYLFSRACSFRANPRRAKVELVRSELMAVTDTIADMLTRIRNAIMACHDSVVVPSFRVGVVIARILEQKGLISGYEELQGKPQQAIRIHLKYDGKQPVIRGLERVSKPGLRVYVGKGEIPRVYGGLGFAMVSTSKGIMTGQEAWRRGIGGELLCYIW